MSATTERNGTQNQTAAAAAAAQAASMLDLRGREREHVTPTSAADQRLRAHNVVMGRFRKEISTGIGYKVGPRLRELTPAARGSQAGGGIHAT